jgi:hypothetical protein
MALVGLGLLFCQPASATDAETSGDCDQRGGSVGYAAHAVRRTSKQGTLELVIEGRRSGRWQAVLRDVDNDPDQVVNPHDPHWSWRLSGEFRAPGTPYERYRMRVIFDAPEVHLIHAEDPC